jgi:hypothetical protein
MENFFEDGVDLESMIKDSFSEKKDSEKPKSPLVPRQRKKTTNTKSNEEKVPPLPKIEETEDEKVAKEDIYDIVRVWLLIRKRSMNKPFTPEGKLWKRMYDWYSKRGVDAKNEIDSSLLKK